MTYTQEPDDGSPVSPQNLHPAWCDQERCSRERYFGADPAAHMGHQMRWTDFQANATTVTLEPALLGAGSPAVRLTLYNYEFVESVADILLTGPDVQLLCARLRDTIGIAEGHDPTVTVASAEAGALELERLHTALDSRAAIGQAQGILMLRYGFTPEQALQALSQQSQQANLELRDLAVEVVGDLRREQAQA